MEGIGLSIILFIICAVGIRNGAAINQRARRIL